MYLCVEWGIWEQNQARLRRSWVVDPLYVHRFLPAIISCPTCRPRAVVTVIKKYRPIFPMIYALSDEIPHVSRWSTSWGCIYQKEANPVVSTIGVYLFLMVSVYLQRSWWQLVSGLGYSYLVVEEQSPIYSLEVPILSGKSVIFLFDTSFIL